MSSVHIAQLVALALLGLAAAYLVASRFDWHPWQALATRHLDPDKAMRLAREHLRQRRFSEAMVIAKRVMRTAPRSVPPRLLLAKILVGLRRNDEAMTALEGLLKLHPGHEEAEQMLHELRRHRVD